MIVLHDYWRSSAAYRLRIALNLLGLDYERAPVDLLAGAHKAPDYLALNKQGLVPTLEIDGKVFTQSLAIIEYLDETHGAGFLPQDPLGRARVRTLSYAIAMDIHPVCNTSVARFATESSGGDLDTKDWMHAFIPERLAAVDAMLGDPATGRFCHGDALTMADICLVPQVYNAKRWEVDLAPLPRLGAIVAHLEAIDAVAAAHPDRVKPTD